MTSRERLTIALLALTSALLRAVAFFRYRFDSDEPQHLHVAWGWTAGLLQYRDVFDNHAPLFHIVTAPILKLVGERDDVLLYMRAPMLIPFAIVVGATYILGTRLYSRRVGAWSAVILSLVPAFFLKSLEYRTDNLWNALWFLSLAVLTGGDPTFARMFIAGLLLGCAFATSMKTTLLVLTLAAAAVMTLVAFRRGRMHVIWPIAIGIPVVPAIIVAYFAHRGALGNLVYCVIDFNELLVRMRPPLSIWLPRVLWIPLIAIAVRIAWRYRPQTDDPAARWRFFFAFGSAFFVITLIGFWILVSPRDLLPCLSFFVIFAVAFVERHANYRLGVYLGASLFFIVLIAHYTQGFANGTREDITMMHQVLRLSRPGEPIMDLKGETVYRPRPFYFIFEYITRNAMERGLIRDTIPEDVIRRQCHVAQADGEFFPPRGRAFLNANFLDMGRLRAAGKWIDVHTSFTIAVPGWYVIVNRRGEVHGMLDGVSYSGPRYLAAGSHVFVTESADRLACLWAPAFQRGFSPFRLEDRDF
jgi:hypothetical protein